MSQQPQDTLTAAYRRASEADAGRPGAATREAVLAQAAATAAARRRAPAANDARYWPRMAAGIAVLGMGVLLWKQTDHRMPGDAAEVVMAPPTPQVERVPESVPEPVPVPGRGRIAQSTHADAQGETPSPAMTSPAAPSSAAPSPVQPSPALPSPPPPLPAPPDPFPNSPRMAEAAAPPPGPKTEAPLPAPPPPSITAPASPPLLAGNQAEAAEAEEMSEVAVTGARIPTPGSARAAAARGGGAPRAGGAGGARAGGPGGRGPPPGQATPQGVDRTALLRQHFPAQYQSDAPHSLWLVLNAAGELVLSGELAPGQRLEDLAPQIASTLGGRVPGPWQAGTVSNARGQPLALAIARLP